MKVQTIETEAGDSLVVLSRRDYDALLARAGDEDAEDRMTLLIAAEARTEQPLPEPVCIAIMAGDSMLRAMRGWRGISQAELAFKSGARRSARLQKAVGCARSSALRGQSRKR